MSQCYLIIPHRDVYSLRRYTTASLHKCVVTNYYCNASSELPQSEIDAFAATQPKYNNPKTDTGMWSWPKTARWPTECENGCGYQFNDDDGYQVFHEMLYRRVDGSEVDISIRNTQADRVGMMWHETWINDPLHPENTYRDAYGKSHWTYLLSPHYLTTWMDKRPPICVVTPSGSQWGIDHKSSNGLGWQVTGEAPNVTCTPSISVPGYHGFLQNGVFTPPLARVSR